MSIMYENIFPKETKNFPWWNNGEGYIYKNTQAEFHYTNELLREKDEEMIINSIEI